MGNGKRQQLILAAEFKFDCDTKTVDGEIYCTWFYIFFAFIFFFVIKADKKCKEKLKWWMSDDNVKYAF